MWVESAHVKRTPPTRAGTLRDGQGPSGRPRDSQGWPGTFQGDSGTFREVRDRIRETQGPGMLREPGTLGDQGRLIELFEVREIESPAKATAKT